jgi:hypothetical protein
MKKLTVKEKRDRIIAYDIISIVEDAHDGKYDYLCQMLTGNGTSPALKWPAQVVLDEWIDGDYDDPDGKEFFVKDSGCYPLVKDLWP